MGYRFPSKVIKISKYSLGLLNWLTLFPRIGWHKKNFWNKISKNFEAKFRKFSKIYFLYPSLQGVFEFFLVILASVIFIIGGFEILHHDFMFIRKSTGSGSAGVSGIRTFCSHFSYSLSFLFWLRHFYRFLYHDLIMIQK